jgi:predicted nucleic acid-binding protein
VTHLLDSSAFFAFYFGEPGCSRVEALFKSDSAEVAVSVLTSVEFWARLKGQGHEEEFDREWTGHLPLFSEVVEVDASLCQAAVGLRRAASARLPTIDSLIAASAARSGAVLVHRDPHFATVPASHLRQELLA